MRPLSHSGGPKTGVRSDRLQLKKQMMRLVRDLPAARIWPVANHLNPKEGNWHFSEVALSATGHDPVTGAKITLWKIQPRKLAASIYRKGKRARRLYLDDGPAIEVVTEMRPGHRAVMTIEALLVPPKPATKRGPPSREVPGYYPLME